MRHLRLIGIALVAGCGAMPGGSGQSGTEAAEQLEAEEQPEEATSPADSDFDGLSDDFEAFLGSDPLDPDTDGDGILDGEEIAYSLEILVPNTIGVVLESYCPDFVLVTSKDAVGVYGSGIFFNGFEQGFATGDVVAFLSEPVLEADPTGVLRANLSIGESGIFDWVGELVLPNLIITGIEPTSNSIEIVLNSIFRISVNPFEVGETTDWFIGDDAVLIGPSFIDPLQSTGDRLINITRCEKVLATLLVP